MIIGCCGAGKSTFAKKLQQQSKLELIHLDQYYWQPNWVEPNKTVWEETVRQLANKEQWIMDGNYSGTMAIRINRADTIIYLDYPTRICFWRVLKRIWRYRGIVRPDMPIGCAERFDLAFLHYVLTYNIRKRQQLLARLQAVEQEKQILVFNTDEETKVFLSQLKQT